MIDERGEMGELEFELVWISCSLAFRAKNETHCAFCHCHTWRQHRLKVSATWLRLLNPRMTGLLLGLVVGLALRSKEGALNSAWNFTRGDGKNNKGLNFNIKWIVNTIPLTCLNGLVMDLFYAKSGKTQQVMLQWSAVKISGLSFWQVVFTSDGSRLS